MVSSILGAFEDKERETNKNRKELEELHTSEPAKMVKKSPKKKSKPKVKVIKKAEDKSFVQKVKRRNRKTSSKKPLKSL